MGEVRVSIEIKALGSNGAVPQRVEALADTGATLTMIPGDVLKRAGVKPEGSVQVRMADGRTTDRPIGFAWVTVEGRSRPATVMFGEAGDMVLLGLTVLEETGLAVDPVNRTLIPAPFNLF
ncbi:MAG: retropepsin-like aspartic protease [Candidatus Coatesbacteria bacterium]